MNNEQLRIKHFLTFTSSMESKFHPLIIPSLCSLSLFAISTNPVVSRYTLDMRADMHRDQLIR